MKHFFSIILAFVVCHFITAQDTLYIDHHTVVEMGETMVIPKNTVVYFVGNYQIAVVGALKAQGTEDQPIIFTSNFDPTMPSTTSWQGISFSNIDENPLSDSSIFEHCIFRHAHAYIGCGATSGFGGAIRAFASSKIRFSNCRFEDNFAQKQGGAVYLESSNAIFDHCIFDHNNTDSLQPSLGGCMAIINAAPSLYHCTISNSFSSSIGGGILAMNCDSTKIVNCSFDGNSGSTGGGMFIANCNYMLFVGNLFHHNIGRYFGGSFALKNTSFRIINCTMADNFGGQGGGVYCSSGVNCNAYNSIFCHNETDSCGKGPQVYIAYQESTINFFNCLVVNGYRDFGGSGGAVNFHGRWHQVIEDDIAFESCNNYNYCLPENSPCINFGNMKVEPELPLYDINGNNRIIDGTVDLGAFESNYTNDIQEFETKSISIYPNPAQYRITISIDNPSLQGTTCSIFDLQGKKLNTFVIHHTVLEIDVAHLPNGIYLLAGAGWQKKLTICR